MKKKILIVGGEGYIGQIVSKKLIENNFAVISYDNLIYDQPRLKIFDDNENFKFVYADLLDLNQLKKSLKDIFGVIILAGLVGDPITKKYPDLSHDINYLGIKEVIDLSILNNVKRIIFVSTCSNYGLIKDNEMADENFVLNPLSLYAKAKVGIEKYILSLKSNTESCITIFRFATAFGLSSRMRYDLTVNEFTRDIFNEKKLEIYDSDTWRPYCHVEDFANILTLALQKEKSKVWFEVFNAGSDGNNLTKKMIIEMILKYKNSSNIQYVDKEGSDKRNYRVNFSKLNKIFNYNCKFSVDDGIKEIIDHLEKLKEDKYDVDDNFGNYKIKN